jgi:vesicle transport protein SEC22
MVLRRLNRNSEPQASIESGQYTLQYVQTLSLNQLAYMELCGTGFPRILSQKSLKYTQIVWLC